LRRLPHLVPAGAPPSQTALALAALGVVYGDIGTSPLYAIRECFHPASAHALALSTTNVLGVLSLVFWSLLVIVSIKYLSFIMRAENQGEGGILALLALLPKTGPSAGGKWIVLAVLFGAALLYGDGVITPAISVLSAIEGLEVATPALRPFVIPLTVAILSALFLVQSRGTARVGGLFGPVTLLWFVAIGALGVREIARTPFILTAIDPRYAVGFFAAAPAKAFAALGAVVLVVTGSEALYADMGHFGRAPIRNTWYGVVLPALLLNYFGQGAILLRDAAAAESPFYALVPRSLHYPMVALATAATIIASQALISGAFSLTQQAVQLGYLPRMQVVHTSSQTEGQIYIPFVNGALLVACLVCVLEFRSSSALAAAYGIAVTGTMAITSLAYYVVVTRAWGWSRARALPLLVLFVAFELSFFGANATKIAQGGWFPLALAAALFVVMTTWRRGRAILASAILDRQLPLESLLEDVGRSAPHRVKGTAVFLVTRLEGAPVSLLHHFKHNKTLHEAVVLLSVVTEHVPEVPRDRRLEVVRRAHGFTTVVARYGFMQRPHVPDVVEALAEYGIDVAPMRVTYFLGRDALVPTGSGKMAGWRKRLFAFVSRNARPATDYFGLPPDRVVEIGVQITF
jgi:KUP system potassium uptake protein